MTVDQLFKGFRVMGLGSGLGSWVGSWVGLRLGLRVGDGVMFMVRVRVIGKG